MERREFVGALGTLGAAAAAGAAMRTGAGTATGGATPAGATVDEWRRHFPSLAQQVNGHPLVYFDTAATSLRPQQVIDAVSHFYATDNANPGGALHTLARRANDAYEGARKTVARFINANDADEVAFTRGTSEAINLVAAAWGGANLKPGDQILIGLAEHASNMVPWQMIARCTGAEVRYFGFDDAGHPSLTDLLAKLTPWTKLVAFSHVSNVLGVINPAADIIKAIRAARPDCVILVDGAQSVPHVAVDVRAMGCDFLAFSSHKMCGPMGVGVLWGKRELLDAMPPYQGGSNMAHDVGLDAMILSPGAHKYGAGTPNVSGPVGLAAAMGFLDSIGRKALWEHEQEVTHRMLARLSGIPGVRVIGSKNAAEKVAVFAFTVEGREPPAVLQALDQRGIAVRAGDLAALPLLKHFGVTRAIRASCYLYSTVAEVDAFGDALERIVAG
ncbi:MAG TPA: aminotransferase class V-fold PLP-dependent enzyme [Gemmatimonadaceae bacterium]